MSATPCPLAIIVPAYKPEFLAEALGSIAAQTDRRFRVYVFDDGSPADLGVIFRQAGLPGNASFHRFEQNVGGRSLVEHWRRCVALTTEPWVWLFSDDDVMSPGCVAAFHAALGEDGEAFNVYRFNTLVIDHQGRVVRIHPPNPARESVEEYIYHQMTHQRLGKAQEHVFRRSAYEARGGFVDFPFALGSDDATWINLVGGDTRFRGIEGPRVCWRLSGLNISALSRNYAAKVLGLFAYASWLYHRPGADLPGLVDGRPATFQQRELVRQWALDFIHRSSCFFTPEEGRALAGAASEKLGIPRRTVWFFLLRNNLFFVADQVKKLLAVRPKRPASAP